MTYKTAETCIKHLQTDMQFKFHHKNFNLFRNNEEVAFQAIKVFCGSFEHIGDELKTDDFTYKALEINPEVYIYARKNPRMANDEKFKKLSAKCERFLYFGSDEVKDNKELVLISVKQNGGTLAYASPRLKDDEEVVLEAVRALPYAINYASLRLQNLCKGNDAAKVLESKLLHDNLQSKLNPNGQKSKKDGGKI